MDKKILFIGACAALALLFVIAAFVFNSQQTTKVESAVSGNLSALDRAGAPTKGPQDAKVTIVEYFDPACGTCRSFYPLVNELINRYPGKVKVVMRYAPLHQGSDQVVKMLEAAHLQGEFWPALELLFASQEFWVKNHISHPGYAKEVLSNLGLNREQFSTDLASAQVAQAVQQDVQDGQTLEVRATPEFFVNGQSMPSFGYEQLEQLVEEAVAKAY
jgi:protein-disulfide isomerase